MTGKVGGMRRMTGQGVAMRGLALVLTAALLSACGGSETPGLMNLRSAGDGPDEFAVLPTKPLQAPADYSQLPVPTPGGANLTDPTPDADAVAALGGNPAAAARQGADGGIVNYASRYGRDPAIRQQLAVADLEFRRAHPGRILERALNVNVYYKAYRGFALDQHAELERWRSVGAATSSAPPQKPQ